MEDPPIEMQGDGEARFLDHDAHHVGAPHARLCRGVVSTPEGTGGGPAAGVGATSGPGLTSRLRREYDVGMTAGPVRRLFAWMRTAAAAIVIAGLVVFRLWLPGLPTAGVRDWTAEWGPSPGGRDAAGRPSVFPVSTTEPRTVTNK